MFLLALLVCVAAGAIYFRGLHRRVLELAQRGQDEQQAVRQMTRPAITTPSDARVKAKLFWASKETEGALAPAEVELPLSAQPAQRARQLIEALIAAAPSPAERTLPADAALLALYLLEDGTAVADFSDALAHQTPSGILSEELAVASMARTLEANAPEIRRLKIVIQGQETETLAGHLDLTGFFEVAAEAEPKPLKAAEEKPRAGLTGREGGSRLKP
jgi:hypothetical protein